MRATHRPARLICVFLVICAVHGCARIPEGRYGINRLRVEGTEQMDPYSVAACLASHERSRMTVTLGRSDTPTCGEAPFDARRLRIPFWRWPWSDWPVYDRVTFDRDIQRIERWYRARGYYDAEVTQVSFDPPLAGENDRFDDDERPCDPARRNSGCEVDIEVHVDEGEPVRVASISMTGTSRLPEGLREELHDAIALEVGERFDESEHDATKTEMIETLREASYACVTIDGRVQINREEHEALVNYAIEPGPRARIGEVTLSGANRVPHSTIIAAADLQRGALYRQSDIIEAQRAIYALGAFSSVIIEPQLSRENCADEVPIHIAVTRGRALRGGVGVGFQVGVDESSDGTSSTDQWDIHLRALLEHRNFLGGLRRLRIEDRPRLIFLAPFPSVSDGDGNAAFNVGNYLTFDFRQPAFVEPLTTLGVNLGWDLGPDNINENYRHNLTGQLRLERSLWGGRIHISGGLRGNLVRYLNPIGDQGTTTPPDYGVLFLEQYFRLDLRDNPRRPRSGMYVGLGVHETGYFLPSSWDYLRFTGDVRFYVPLPLGMVLATRFSIGAMHITDIHVEANEPVTSDCAGIECTETEPCTGSPDLDRECGFVSQPRRNPADPSIPDSEPTNDFDLCPYGQLCLGPDEYRLRGGGAMGNRGFRAGNLGDPSAPQNYSASELGTYDDSEGGLRRWEASVELRVPLSDELETALFLDAGDVNRLPRFRFDYLHLTFGMGVRYQTLVGPIRLDAGYRIPGAQVLGEVYPEASGTTFWDRVRLHLTIGEAF